tara:strand:+ start:4149 stop:4988 length:840 start_codon:yes stop_codon:yes gene_type:complete
MIDRKELVEEVKLRKSIRKVITIIQERKRKDSLQEEMLRDLLRPLIAEAAVASAAKHDSTGINALEDLLKNTNILSVVGTGYKSLTTRTKDDPEEGQTIQRMSYENHILRAVQKSLAPEESRKEAGEDVEITEEIEIEIGDRPEDDPDFIDADDDGKEEKPEPPDPREKFGIKGEDKTGRNRAFTDFTEIEKVILTAFDDLDNPEDISLFEEYLLKNLALYFEKFENELATNVSAPRAAQDAVADTGEPEFGGETEVPEFELQEVLRHLDIDDIITNLL